MRKIAFVIALLSSILAYSENTFYVVMKDGSVEYYPVEKLDSATFIEPKVEKVRGFNDMALEIFNLRRELDSLKANCCKMSTSDLINFSINNEMGYVMQKDLPLLGITSDTLVDLGLSVDWTSMNIGAEKSYDYGDYYQWGSTKVFDNYVEDSCVYLKFDTLQLVEAGYCDKHNNLKSIYDVATAKWGKGFRMPTKEEITELSNNTVSRWISIIVDDSTIVSGMYFRSIINGNSIFLPASGERIGEELYNEAKLAMYWSSTASSSTYYSWCIYFDYSKVQIGNDKRYYGVSVRPVHEKKH